MVFPGLAFLKYDHNDFVLISWTCVYLLFSPICCSSAFHLSYNMLLNQLRCEDGDPENLLRNSFYQFQADRALPDLKVCYSRSEMCNIICVYGHENPHLDLELLKEAFVDIISLVGEM